MRADIIKELRVNQRIKTKEVRVISETGGQLGIMPLFQALELARQRNCDLVEVAPTAVPPVCRLLDYGKYKYELEKKERKARKGQRAGLLKQVRLGPKINEHDLEAKIRTVKKLLAEGDKVRVFVIFRGREITHPELGWKILQKVAEALKETTVIEGSPSKEGKIMSLVLSPASTRQAKEVKAGKGA